MLGESGLKAQHSAYERRGDCTLAKVAGRWRYRFLNEVGVFRGAALPLARFGPLRVTPRTRYIALI